MMVEQLNSNMTKDISMWKSLKLKQKVYGSQQVVYERECFAVRREDGFTLSDTDSTREYVHTFLAQGEFGEFRFYATRVADEGETLLDYYIVETTMGRTIWPGGKEHNRKLLLKYAKDVEEGLLNFPVTKFANYEPIKKVLFNLNKTIEPRQLVSAEEICSGY